LPIVDLFRLLNPQSAISIRNRQSQNPQSPFRNPQSTYLAGNAYATMPVGP
jgi:hypothetical protein